MWFHCLWLWLLSCFSFCFLTIFEKNANFLFFHIDFPHFFPSFYECIWSLSWVNEANETFYTIKNNIIFVYSIVKLCICMLLLCYVPIVYEYSIVVVAEAAAAAASGERILTSRWKKIIMYRIFWLIQHTTQKAPSFSMH